MPTIIPNLVPTEDGSPTLYNAQIGEHYHSIHGAIQESRHIFIESALKERCLLPYSTPLQILEVGFGTGLNALMTLLDSLPTSKAIHYTSLELYPVPKEVYKSLHFTLDHPEADSLLQELHQAPWNELYKLQSYPHFTLEKRHIALEEFQPLSSSIDIIYFDAFSPEAQGELWTENIFRRLYTASREQAILSTYCAKGEVRRRLQRAGWFVERLAGPPGKREMLRGRRLSINNQIL